FAKRKILIASTWTAEIATQLFRDYVRQPFRDFVPLYSFFCDGGSFAGGELAIGEPFHRYYQKHISEFSEVTRMLADERSREMLQKIVLFRCYAFEPHRLQAKDFPYLAAQFEDHLREVLRGSKRLLDCVSDAGLRYTISQALLTAPYSYLNLITPEHKTKIIDAGAFDGDTAGMFALLSPDSSIFSFEPVNELYVRLVGLSRLLTEIRPVRAAVWHHSGKIGFQENDLTPNMSGINDTTAASTVRATSLDDFVETEGLAKVDFVKMDIEGAELQALKGAEKVLRAFKPDLAICVYHRPEHLWQIPLWIKETVPDYNIYLDHKSQGLTDSICFASMN
ncbi:MAG: FkbM family methyltransferase, partial [bacterium]